MWRRNREQVELTWGGQTIPLGHRAGKQYDTLGIGSIFQIVSHLFSSKVHPRVGRWSFPAYCLSELTDLQLDTNTYKLLERRRGKKQTQQCLTNTIILHIRKSEAVQGQKHGDDLTVTSTCHSHKHHCGGFICASWSQLQLPVCPHKQIHLQKISSCPFFFSVHSCHTFISTYLPFSKSMILIDLSHICPLWRPHYYLFLLFISSVHHSIPSLSSTPLSPASVSVLAPGFFFSPLFAWLQ